jgi:hypothetical protein
MTNKIITDEGDFIYFSDLNKDYRIEHNGDESLKVDNITLNKEAEQKENTYRVTNTININ